MVKRTKDIASLENFLKRFTANITKINTIPKIDSGGCGIFALYLYKRLKDLGYKRIYIRALLYTDKNYICNDDFNILINKRNIDHDTFDHIVIHVIDSKGVHYLLDSNGVETYIKPLRSGKIVIDINDDEAYLGNITTYETLAKSISFKFWCSLYDRKNNKKLKKLINDI